LEEGFDYHMKNVWDVDKFDVVIGNPPYQLNVGVEKDNYSIPLYHKFVQQAIKLNPNDFEVYTNRGAALRRLRKYELALESYIANPIELFA
jgi:23S rRNA G2445 N2-methylase RlmL